MWGCIGGETVADDDSTVDLHGLTDWVVVGINALVCICIFVRFIFPTSCGAQETPSLLFLSLEYTCLIFLFCLLVCLPKGKGGLLACSTVPNQSDLLQRLLSFYVSVAPAQSKILWHH